MVLMSRRGRPLLSWQLGCSVPAGEVALSGRMPTGTSFRHEVDLGSCAGTHVCLEPPGEGTKHAAHGTPGESCSWARTALRAPHVDVAPTREGP